VRSDSDVWCFRISSCKEKWVIVLATIVEKRDIWLVSARKVEMPVSKVVASKVAEAGNSVDAKRAIRAGRRVIYHVTVLMRA